MAARRVHGDPRLRLPPGPGLSAEDVAAHQTGRIEAALIGIVAESGYEKLKVRDLVKAAHVSTRAFYERYGSKEDCFLQTYDLLARRATRRLIAAQAGESDWRKRPRLVIDELARQLEHSSNAARFMLIDAYTAGPAARERAWRAERHLEGMLAESLARPPGGVSVPPLVVEGMLAGVVHVARNRLSSERLVEMGTIGEALARWALSYAKVTVRELEELDRGSVWRNTMLKPLPEPGATTDEGTWPPTGDRALILSTVARLAVADGYSSLTASRIRATAGVTRSTFDACFDSVEACYVAAIEARTAEALAQAARAQTAAHGWEGGVYRAIAALCEVIEGDAFLAGACLADELPRGSEGLRARQRLTSATIEQLQGSVPREARPSRIVAEASAGAVWGVFHHHMIRNWTKHRQIAATLAYLALAPIVGGPAAIAAIRAEQSA